MISTKLFFESSLAPLPLVNASRPPEQWQTYNIIFHAPQCGPERRVVGRARVTELHNRVLVQDNVQIQKSDQDCVDEGPLMLQDHNYPGAPITVMRFRNIWFRPL